MMILGVVLLFGVGLFLSAFFSGSETGFYRVNRARLVLDSRSGDWVAAQLLRFTNHPTLFVATVLVGNNIANNVTSLAVVLAASWIPAQNAAFVESVLPILVSPIVFVYGELLPKYLFYQSPNRLLRKGGPLFLLFAVVFAPVTALLWLFGRVLQRLVGQTPLRIAFKVARSELAQMVREGEEAGILEPSQALFTQAIIETGPRPIAQLCTPISRVPTIPLGSPKRDVFRLARRQRSPRIAVRDARRREIIGYVRVIDLHLCAEETVNEYESFLELRDDLPHVEALVELRRTGKEWGLVRTADDSILGVISVEQLLSPLLRDA